MKIVSFTLVIALEIIFQRHMICPEESSNVGTTLLCKVYMMSKNDKNAKSGSAKGNDQQKNQKPAANDKAAAEAAQASDKRKK